MNKLLMLSLFLSILSTPVQAGTNWTVDGDMVYVNDSKAYISASPHTISESQWVTFNVSSKMWSGDIDIIFGFDNEKVKPKKVELYNPKTVQLPNITTSKTFFNVTSIGTTTDPLEYGNEYNKYKRRINYSIIAGYNNVTNATVWSTVSTVVAFDSCFREENLSCTPFVSNKNYTVTWNTTRFQNTTWQNVASKFNSINWEHDGLNKWYYAKGLPINAGKYYNLRVWVDVPITLGNHSSKYGFGIKPSFQTLQEAKNANTFYYLDPWWYTSWKRKAAILINNTGNANTLTDYQVNLNITYDSDMNVNFSDIRVVNDTSGLTVPYWIESKVDSSYANIWFNATSIPASMWTNSTYYLYYGDPPAASASNGVNTFIAFDDFDDNNLVGWNYDTTKWSASSQYVIKSGTTVNYLRKATEINNYILEGKVRTPSSSGQYLFIYGRKADTDVDTGVSVSGGLGGGGGTQIAKYSIWKGNGWVSSGTLGASDINIWHAIKLVLSSSDATLYSDPNVESATTLRLSTTTASVLTGATYGFTGMSIDGQNYDNFRVRKYASPEPNAFLGTEETLSCGILDIDGGYYKLYNNVSSDGTCFTIGANNITLDGAGYTVFYGQTELGTGIKIPYIPIYNITIKNINLVQSGLNSDSSGLHISGDQDDGHHTVTGCNITALNGYGVWLTFTNNNTFDNNIIYSESNYAFSLDASKDNIIKNGSIISKTNYDYWLRDNNYYYPYSNYFYRTNFTAPRKIYFFDTTPIFNYSNGDDVWLATSILPASTYLTRNLSIWSQSQMKWNDSATVTAYYNISGLLPDMYYKVYNNSIHSYDLTTDSNGNLPVFSIALNGQTEIHVRVSWTLNGYVRNDLYVPLEKARVDYDDNYTFTDANGYYEFLYLSDGEYTVLARAIGYRNSTVPISIVSDTVLNFILSERTYTTDIENSGMFGFIGGVVGAIIVVAILRRKK